VTLTPVLAPAALGIVGFSAVGPVAGEFLPQAEVESNASELLGTVAAGIQAGIGNVAVGSAFAAAQSIAMGGAIPTVISAVSAGLGAGIGARAAGSGGSDAAGGDGGGEKATGEGAGGEHGTTGDAGEGVPRTGPNRCRESQHRRERFCRHRISKL
jgi:hypothetical protein